MEFLWLCVLESHWFDIDKRQTLGLLPFGPLIKDLPPVRVVFLPLECRVVVGLDAPDPVGASLSHTQDDASDQVLPVLDGLPQRLPKVLLNQILELLVHVASDGVGEHGFHSSHQNLEEARR